MIRRLTVATSIVATMHFAPAIHAQGHQHPAPGAERLGTVHFPTSCAASVAPAFDRAMALLHSFEFGAAIRGFEQVLAADADCAMAYWGIALSRWTNPMVPSPRPAAVLDRGRQAVADAARVAAGATDRERAYLAAVGELFADHGDRDHRARVVAYERAMASVVERFPDDNEARIFHALSLVGSALPTDKTYANQIRAGETLEALFAKHPDHPGLAHYIIHSYDVPALAGRAAAAAQRYADIAPSASHALHMPSHTFTRVGLWDESVRTNMRSFEVAERDAFIAEALHAADYAVYANLQMKRDSAALAMLRRLPALAERFDPEAVTGAAPGSAGVFALAAIPARYALERRAWKEAAALESRPTAFAYADALTWFARALGAARSGDPASTAIAADTLAALQQRLVAGRDPYWAEQVDIQRVGAQAWAAFASGRKDEALTLMREAATREDRTEKAAVTPGPLAPARELLGDMLLEAGRPAEALAEYRAALTREPGRYHTLSGAARSAAAAGDHASAARFEAELARLTRR